MIPNSPEHYQLIAEVEKLAAAEIHEVKGLMSVWGVAFTLKEKNAQAADLFDKSSRCLRNFVLKRKLGESTTVRELRKIFDV